MQAKESPPGTWGLQGESFMAPPRPRSCPHTRHLVTPFLLRFLLQKNKNKKKGKDEKCGSEVTTPENSSSPGMMDMHGELPRPPGPLLPGPWAQAAQSYFVSPAGSFTFQAKG